MDVASGTSMASPHVAGGRPRWYLQAQSACGPERGSRPRWRTAPTRWPRRTAPLEPVVRQGSGLVDIDDAIQATTRITPGTPSRSATTALAPARR